mmetsp:Transcript_78585/g.230558  ORF Transcript_78585/g.230558 Transcript_78585/m.230558 type:complete len:226 (+) Transcript_78585:856-1533(+)
MEHRRARLQACTGAGARAPQHQPEPADARPRDRRVAGEDWPSSVPRLQTYALAPRRLGWQLQDGDHCHHLSGAQRGRRDQLDPHLRGAGGGHPQPPRGVLAAALEEWRGWRRKQRELLGRRRRELHGVGGDGDEGGLLAAGGGRGPDSSCTEVPREPGVDGSRGEGGGGAGRGARGPEGERSRTRVAGRGVACRGPGARLHGGRARRCPRRPGPRAGRALEPAVV